MRRSILLVVSLCFAVVSVIPLAAADLVSGRCQMEIENEIAKLSIPPERVKDLQIINIYEGSGEGGGRIDHIEGWVSFNDCKGNLVVSISTACIPQEIYTTYECRVPGVKNY